MPMNFTSMKKQSALRLYSPHKQEWDTCTNPCAAQGVELFFPELQCLQTNAVHNALVTAPSSNNMVGASRALVDTSSYSCQIVAK